MLKNLKILLSNALQLSNGTFIPWFFPFITHLAVAVFGKEENQSVTQ